MLRLSVQDSKRRKEVVIGRSEILIGTRADADICLEANGAAPTHCLIRIEGGSVTLVDLASAAGTKVNGKSVREHALRRGDIIQVGVARIRIEALALTPDQLKFAAKPHLAEPKTAATNTKTRIPAPLVQRIAPPDFGREIREMVAKAPWYMISLGVHAVMIFILHLIPFQVQTTEPVFRLTAQEDQIAPEPEAPLELPEPGDDELAPPTPPMPLEPEESSEPAKEVDWSEKKPLPVKIGLHNTRMTKIVPGIRIPVTKGAGKAIRGEDIGKANANAARAVGNRLGEGEQGLLNGLAKGRILVVRGDHDAIERVLDKHNHLLGGKKGPPDKSNRRYLLIDRQSLLKRKLKPHQILFVNCADRPVFKANAQIIASKIKKFVGDGGWLMTSDWALDPYILGAFPHALKLHISNKFKRQPDITVRVRAGPNADHPIIRRVFERRVQTQWWIEESSFFFTRKDPKVEILIQSDELLKDWGAREIAVAFRYRKGYVVHMLGHFWQEDGNRQGLVSMHRLILNFIIEKLRSEKS